MNFRLDVEDHVLFLTLLYENTRRWAGGKGDVVTRTIHAEDNPKAFS